MVQRLTTMLSSLPSTGIPYVAGGALPAWQWTRSSPVPGPHAYMPYFMPRLQGVVATQNWNNYLVVVVYVCYVANGNRSNTHPSSVSSRVSSVLTLSG